MLGIESSCDDTAAAVLVGGRVVATVVSTQLRHAEYGGVVPEMAARMHQTAIVPVVAEALRQANVSFADLHAVAVTAGPGLMGSLLVGLSYAKGLALALGIPLITVDHLRGHLASLYLADEPPAEGPLVALIASGGHTQIELVHSPTRSERLGQTRDDAAGEAFDKIAKLLGMPYPGGAALDALAESGDDRFVNLRAPRMEGYDFSFSGLKTAFLYHLRAAEAEQPNYADEFRPHLAASLRRIIVEMLVDKLFAAADAHQVQQVGLAGGVAANRLLRRRVLEECSLRGWRAIIPPLAYCTDNAAMIAFAGWQLALTGSLATLDAVPYPSGSTQSLPV